MCRPAMQVLAVAITVLFSLAPQSCDRRSSFPA
jgi:hypothetical protein